MAKHQLNFTSEETEVFLGLVKKGTKVLFASFGTGLSSAVKDKTWKEVASSVSAVSGVRRLMAEVSRLLNIQRVTSKLWQPFLMASASG